MCLAAVRAGVESDSIDAGQLGLCLRGTGQMQWQQICEPVSSLFGKGPPPECFGPGSAGKHNYSALQAPPAVPDGSEAADSGVSPRGSRKQHDEL